MRLAALLVAVLPLSAGPSLAQDAAVLSFSQVSLSWPADAVAGPSSRALLTDGNRGGEFDLGTPEGSGFDVAPVKRAASPAVVRMGQNRTKKAFGMPWQTGIFQ